MPKGYFGCSRRLRQGDPLFPFLFLLVAGVLRGLIGKAMEVGMIKGFSMCQGEVVVSHLQFAYDTIIFCDNFQHHTRMLRGVLWCFEVVSDLRLNLAKSSLIAVGEVPNMDQLAADLGCRRAHLPSTYLGLSLGSTYKQKEV